MRFRRIEVDEEVYAYLQKRAEPFVDTPNTILRRELLGKRDVEILKPKSETEEVASSKLDFHQRTPAALKQILEVIHRVIKNGVDRQSATNMVARAYGIAPQTVLDKYCRQLDLCAYEFDHYLGEPGYNKLKSLLFKRFPNFKGPNK